MKTEELFRADSYRTETDARIIDLRVLEEAENAVAVVLDRTVFYPRSGGQAGDIGTLTPAGGRPLPVTDTRYDRADGAIVHLLAPGAVTEVGEAVNAAIDWPRRHRLMRMHSCLHLLCGLIEGAVTGCDVSDGKGRMDFDVPEAVLDKADLTARLNAIIARDLPVTPETVAEKVLDDDPDLVRTLSVSPPRGSGEVRLIRIADVDVQPCGGTHVRSTAEIGSVEVAKIEKKGQKNRRVTVRFADTS